MPKLPVAKVLWKPQPSLNEAANAWIYAGGAHHTCFSFDVSIEQLQDLTRMFDIENILIDEKATGASIEKEDKAY